MIRIPTVKSLNLLALKEASCSQAGRNVPSPVRVKTATESDRSMVVAAGRAALPATGAVTTEGGAAATGAAGAAAAGGAAIMPMGTEPMARRRALPAARSTGAAG